MELIVKHFEPGEKVLWVPREQMGVVVEYVGAHPIFRGSFTLEPQYKVAFGGAVKTLTQDVLCQAEVSLFCSMGSHRKCVRECPCVCHFGDGNDV